MSPERTLSRPERRVFLAVAEALVDAPVEDDVANAVIPFVRRLPLRERRLFRLLLRAIEFGVVLSVGRPVRFSALPRAERQRCLRDWARSRLSFRRQGVAALKSLAALAYYGRESAWDDVGYDGPWLGRMTVAVHPAPALDAPAVSGAPAPPASGAESRPDGSGGSLAAEGVSPAGRVTTAPIGARRVAITLAPGITPATQFGQDAELRAEVCVIGTGAGGAALIGRLAERGVDVVAVEAGPHFRTEDYDQRELSMLPRLYQDAGMRFTADQAIGILQGCGVGGSTLHNTGMVYPPPRGVLERWRREYGFPVGEAEMASLVDWVLAGLRAVPIPPERINANNDVLRRGAAALGWRYRVPLHNRVECSGCGYCMLGCAYNRKTNAAFAFLPRAVAGGARIVSCAQAVRIRGRSGDRRVECLVLDDRGRWTGGRFTVRAPVVVLAAGALDTPALLLRSGLGNDRVGAGLRLHPAAFVAGEFGEPIMAWRGIPQSVIVEEFAPYLEDGGDGYLIVASAANTPGMTAALMPGFGPVHRAAMQRMAHHACATVLLHDETAGRVTVRRSGRPVAQYWPDPADLRQLQHGIGSLARIYLAAGAVQVRLPYVGAPAVCDEAGLMRAQTRARREPFSLPLNSVHPQGSCALGRSRRNSAVDPHGELWGERGVFVCDTSLFPTSVGVPPQVTAMALAAAVADYIAVERRG